jgi:tRNA C32,U32 (ribose-2'-O)-methylase TrmJ
MNAKKIIKPTPNEEKIERCIKDVESFLTHRNIPFKEMDLLIQLRNLISRIEFRQERH